MATLVDFKNTNPSDYGSDNVNLFVEGSGPYTLVALTVPVSGFAPGDIKTVLQQVEEIRFTFVNETRKVKISDRQLQIGGTGKVNYMYFELISTQVSSLPTNIVGGLPTEEGSRFNFIPYFSFNFLTDDFNVLINNSERSKLSASRRIVDRVNSQANPTNLQAIVSQSATFAEVQECNYSKRSVINARYLGSKLSSGSIQFNDPALTFIPFQASVHGTSVSYDKIISIPLDQREVETLYFNPVFPGDLKSVPTEGRPVYREESKRFVRLENVKFYIPDAEIVGVIGSGTDTTTAFFTTTTIPPQTSATGSALSGSTHYEYIVSNYDRNNTAFIQYISGSSNTSTNIPADSEIVICASKIITYSGVAVTKGGTCT